MGTTLVISHNLFLTEKERYEWHDGKTIETVGVSVPVWFGDGVSSEPAVEIFCKYKLFVATNIFIKHVPEGYEVSSPSEPAEKFTPLPDAAWNTMTSHEQEVWYEENESKPSLRMLLNFRDGGGQYLGFRQTSKVRQDKKALNVMHFMEIKDMQELLKTLV